MEAETKGGDDAEAMATHRRHLGRGFNWLGGATIIAKLTDFSTILIVLLYLTKQQMGIGSIVIAIGTVVEAFDGLGTGDALVQAERISRKQLDSLFWFILGAAMLAAIFTLAAAPLVQEIYGSAGMAAYFIAVAAKQPLVGAAVIPLALLNRELRYERIAVINVAATFGAALTRLGVALAGGGAWALVSGYTASGVFILAGALLARPFRPALSFRMAPILPLVQFGLRSASANVFEQIFKNIDYLLVGWFYGPAQLAVYRVAFGLAMEPAMAVGTLINRTALPVFARVATVPGQLREALLWSLQRLTTLVAPCMVALMLLAVPLTALLHDSQGNSYAGAALPLQILAAAAILRVSSQLLTPVLMSSGHPGTAAGVSAATLTLLGTGILAAGFSFRAHDGIIAVAAVWFAVYPLLLCWGVRYLRQHWQIRLRDLLRPFLTPGIGIAAMVTVTTALQCSMRSHSPELRIGIVLAVVGLTYAGLILRARRTSRAQNAQLSTGS
jgi:O-antigen/teichoic acid export membrane protein